MNLIYDSVYSSFGTQMQALLISLQKEKELMSSAVSVTVE